jgi:eukaryotic-like serine/threonine-protein kinase
LWIVPFACYLTAYACMGKFFGNRTIQAPYIVGKTVRDAVLELSAYNLNMRVLSHAIDADLPDGTIVEQMPLPGVVIKPYQSLYVVISKKPDSIKTPLCIGKSYNEIVDMFKSAGIKGKFYRVSSTQPIDYCISQMPLSGSPIEHDGVTVYLASPGITQSYVLVPDMRGALVQEIREMLALYGIKLDIQRDEYSKHNTLLDECIIIAQKPLAGSLIKIENNTIVQLLVQ